MLPRFGDQLLYREGSFRSRHLEELDMIIFALTAEIRELAEFRGDEKSLPTWSEYHLRHLLDIHALEYKQYERLIAHAERVASAIHQLVASLGEDEMEFLADTTEEMEFLADMETINELRKDTGERKWILTSC